MKRTAFNQIGRAFPFVSVAATILIILVVLTTPLAVSRYTAQGQGEATARIAAWDIKLTSIVPDAPSSVPSEDGGIIKLRAGYTSHVVNAVVNIKNNSEVMAEATPDVDFANKEGGVSSGNVTVTFDPVSKMLAPGEDQDFEMTVTTSATTDGYVSMKIVLDAVQVD